MHTEEEQHKDGPLDKCIMALPIAIVLITIIVAIVSIL